LQGYIIRRIIGAVFVVFLAGTFSFFAIRILPGDAATAALGLDAGSASSEQIAERKAEYGLDKPLHVQYGDWLWNTVRLDLGNSFINRANSVWYEIGRSLPYSIELGVLIMIVGFAVAFPVGIISALFQDRALDYGLRTLAILALAAPVFWTAAIASLLVLQWDLFLIDVIGQPHLWEDPGKAITWYLIPMFAGGFAGTAATMRLLRSQMLEVMRQDYVRTARAKGLRESVVILRHSLRNALLPVLTVMGVTVATIIGSQVILENMFNIPGIGNLIISSLFERDNPVFQSVIVLIAVFVVVTNLVVDILYGIIDPRIRLS
jgi:peptide/nickel transport system permease protein